MAMPATRRALCHTTYQPVSISIARLPHEQPLKAIALLACRHSITTTYAAGRPLRPASRDHRTMHALRAAGASASQWMVCTKHQACVSCKVVHTIHINSGLRHS